LRTRERAVRQFNARLRDELLNGEIFYTLREPQTVIESVACSASSKISEGFESPFTVTLTVGTHIATLVERNTRFTMLVKIPRKDTTTVVAALAKHISKLPEELRRSLTWDQGKEMHAHKRFTVATKVQVYFCDPRSPWQRGSNENTNGLLRQYLPRGTDFSRISQSYLNAIALRLNQRPRKTLGFQTPANRLQAVLH
jgi:IS30 family transposase